MPPQLPANVNKILVCQLRQIGDVLLSTPAVELLKQAFPAAEIHFFTEKKCAAVLENNPHISKVWTLDKKELNHLGREVPFYFKVARQGYDIVVDFQQLPRIRWVVAFSCAPLRLSYKAPWYTSWLYNLQAVPLGGYAAKAKASVLAPLGIEWRGEKPRIYLSDIEKAWWIHFAQEQHIDSEDIVITLDPSHRRITRCWPAEHYAKLIDLAVREDPRFKFILLFGPGEEQVAETVRSQCQSSQNVVLPKRMLTLREMASVINAARLHVGNCSSPRHFAVAVDTPSLTILGSTSNAWTFPGPEHRAVSLGLECQPCNKNSCPRGGNHCLTDLAPEVVLPDFLKMVSQ